MMPEANELWSFLPLGYALSVALEMPVLLLGLSRRHSLARRILAAFWLTAGTYPIVVLVLPPLFTYLLGPESYWPYLIVAEIFAPAAECAMFYAAFGRDLDPRNKKEVRRDLGQDMLAILAANLCSFAVGGWLLRLHSTT